ncbi:MAG TPA: response regulator transcription factor [Verrucomicrobiae bacterium]|nr:response regulator transcription factor [Verrucomicrobiae bacterium]
MASRKILVIDDDPQMRRVMRATLVSHGYEVVESPSGEQALQTLRAQPCDFVLLDINLPGLDGIRTCRAIRTTYEIPIIVISVRGSEKDKVTALEAGADDYVTKPFGLPELLARIQAVTRRGPKIDGQPRVLVLDKVAVDFETHRVSAPDREAERLTPKEFDLLRFLVSHAGKVISHRRLLQAVWGPDYGDEVEYLRVVINQLRNKIEEDAHNPKYLLTEPWVGYRFVAPLKTQPQP